MAVGLFLDRCLDGAEAEPAPAYLWSNRNAGLPPSEAGINAIALSKAGAPFVTGFFLGTLSLGTNILTSVSTNYPFFYDAFVARCDEDGNYLWVRQISGLRLNQSTFVALDSRDNPIVCGAFSGTISLGGAELTSSSTNSEAEIFLAKFDAAGELLWAKTVGRFGSTVAVQHQPLLALDSAGNIYLTGHFGGSFGGPLLLGSTNLANSGSQDVFLAKYDPAGNFLWARSAGGVSGGDAVNFSRGIAVDATGHPFIAGSFSRRMDIGATNLISAGVDDIFLARFDGDGDLLWARQGGGPGKDQATAIAVAASGYVFIAGKIAATLDGRIATFGDLSLTISGEGAGDDFVVMYDPEGNAVLARQVAGSPDQLPAGVTFDAQGNSYVLGSFSGAVSVFGLATLFSPYQNYYVAKFRNDGSAVWALQGREEGNFTEGWTIAVNSSGNAYVGGRAGADLFLGKLAVDDGHSPPTVLQQPAASLLVHAGGSATFSVLAAGAQPASYQWRFNGTDILGATNISWTLTNVTSAPAGGFSVVVSNAFGVTTSSDGAIVLAPPTTLPDFLWLQGGGGYGWDAGTGVAVDEAGGVYVTGFYELWADFNGTWWFAARGASAAHQRDMFIAKYDRTGSPLWIRSAGSDLEDEGRGVAVDRLGNVYVTGPASALSPGAIFEIGNITLTNTDRFAAKFDSNGNLLWAIPAGGSAVAVDDWGHLYLAGEVSSPPMVIGTTTLTNRGAFLAKYNSDASPLWARQFAGTFLGVGRMIAPAGSNVVYVTGGFEATAEFDGIMLTNRSDADAFFLAKYSSSGDLFWVRHADPAYRQNGAQITADPDGGCYWAGAFSGTLMLEGAGVTSLGEVNTFLSRFTPEGDLQWLRHLKGTNIVLGRTLCLDRFGNLLLAGEFTGNLAFESRDIPTLSPIGSPSVADVFLAWYDGEGNFRGVRQIGSPASEGGFSLTTGGSGHVYLTGQFGDYLLAGETLSMGPTTLTSHGRFDFYLAELDALPPTLRVGRSSGDVVISCPAAATSYVLQAANSLASPHWNVVTNSWTSAGHLKSVLLTPSDRQTFYRLSEP
jgi:hypothetical protein